MQLSELVPFRQATVLREARTKKVRPVDSEDRTKLGKALKVASLALGFSGATSYNATDRANFEECEYDMDRILQAIDTDSYAKQAFRKYRELFWKEGWDLVGENPKAIDYLWRRFDFMEMAMNRPFQDFLAEAADQLCKFSNVFIVKARDKTGTLKRTFPGYFRLAEGENPIVGYYLIPTEQVEILRDRHNRPKKYRQRQDPTNISNNTESRAPTWLAKNVIHLHLEKKPGRAFGTPMITSGLDDITALRQIEEDIQNLVHRDLHPLYKYTIGTDAHPAEGDEVEKASAEIESIRYDGAVVMPHRHDIDVIGSEGESLSAEPYLNHFKERVAVGLGVFPHHLGMVGTTGNKDMTDRLDVSLYDKIKEIQSGFSDSVRHHILNDLLMEGGFDPIVNPRIEGPSDRCDFRFNEIDVDTQVKKENHIMGLVTSNLTTISEGRFALKKDPVLDEEDTLAALQARMAPDTPTSSKSADGGTKPEIIDVTPAAARKDRDKSSSGGRPNPKNLKKGPGNVVAPANQFGRRTNPGIRQSDVSYEPVWLDELETILDEGYNVEGDGKDPND